MAATRRRARARWTVATSYHQDGGSVLVRPRLAVLDTRQGGRIWIGRDTPRARRAARQLAAILNRRPRRATR